MISRSFEPWAVRGYTLASLDCKANSLKVKWSPTVSARKVGPSVRTKTGRCANSIQLFRSTRSRPGCEPNDPQDVYYAQWGRDSAVATHFGAPTQP